METLLNKLHDDVYRQQIFEPFLPNGEDKCAHGYRAKGAVPFTCPKCLKEPETTYNSLLGDLEEMDAFLKRQHALIEGYYAADTEEGRWLFYSFQLQDSPELGDVEIGVSPRGDRYFQFSVVNAQAYRMLPQLEKLQVFFSAFSAQYTPCSYIVDGNESRYSDASVAIAVAIGNAKLAKRVLKKRKRKTEEERVIEKQILLTPKGERTVRATNGKTYVITGDKVVKRVLTGNKNEFVANNKKWALNQTDSVVNTKVLESFLRGHLDHVYLRRNYVLVNGYKIRYVSHGFRIVDDWNFGKLANCNKYNNDMATPEDVLRFIQGTEHRTIGVPEAATTRNKLKQQLEKSSFKIKIDKKMETETAKQEKKAKEKIEKITKPKKAPKFVAPQHEEVYNLVVTDAKLKKTASRNRFGEYQADDMMTFTSKGPSGKRFTKTCTVAEYLTRFVLAELPKAMPLLMKVANGEQVDDLAFVPRFIKDPTVEYSLAAITGSTHKKELMEMCMKILGHYGLPTALNRVYDTELRPKDKVRVYFPDSFAWFGAVVKSIEDGVVLDYTGGVVEYMWSHIRYEVVQTTKK